MQQVILQLQAEVEKVSTVSKELTDENGVQQKHIDVGVIFKIKMQININPYSKMVFFSSSYVIVFYNFRHYTQYAVNLRIIKLTKILFKVKLMW